MVENPKPGDPADIMAELQAIIFGRTPPLAPPLAAPPAPAPEAASPPPNALEPAAEPPASEPKTPPQQASPAAPAIPPTAPAASGTPPQPQTPPAPSFEVLYPKAKPDFSSIPPNQIRRVALLYLAGQEAKLKRLFQLLESVARTAGKDPIYFDIGLVAKINPPGMNFQGLMDKIQDAHAIAAIGILFGLPWASLNKLRRDFQSAQVFFRAVEENDIQKKENIVDLSVELWLLGSPGTQTPPGPPNP